MGDVNITLIATARLLGYKIVNGKVVDPHGANVLKVHIVGVDGRTEFMAARELDEDLVAADILIKYGVNITQK